jgi:hypothetical protein
MDISVVEFDALSFDFDINNSNKIKYIFMTHEYIYELSGILDSRKKKSFIEYLIDVSHL